MNLENRYVRHTLRISFDLLFGKSVRKSLSLFSIDECSISVDDSDLVFIFQGPVVRKEDLHLGLHAYRTTFPNSQIILSTWTKKDVDLEFMRISKVTTVFPTPPEKLGVLGVNRQIVGVGAAMESIEQWRRNENTIVFKLRTDYFPMRPRDLYCIQKSFSELFGSHRIWGVDINTKKNIPYSFSDILNCGSYSKMEIFWRRCPQDEHGIDRKEFFASTDGGKNLNKIIGYGSPEIYLTCNYLKKLGYSIDVHSLTQYHSLIGKEFGVLDANQIGLAFDKYSVIRSGYGLAESNVSVPLLFADWISLATRNE